MDPRSDAPTPPAAGTGAAAPPAPAPVETDAQAEARRQQVMQQHARDDLLYRTATQIQLSRCLTQRS